jgi:hypothetical protein
MGDSLPLAKPLTIELKVLGTGNSDKADIMLSFGFGSRAGERLTYRGYDLEIAKDPVGWRLGVYPSRPELPILARSNFTVPSPRKDDALSAARERIDLLLSA